MNSSLAGTAILALSATVLGPAAQAAPLAGFVLTAQTAHFSFYSRGAKVDARRVEQRVGEIERMLGQRLGRRADYYRYGSAQEVAAGTGHYASGVTFADVGEVHSAEACHDHELVHLVAGQLGDPGAFFQEGLAVAIGNEGRWRGRSVDEGAKATTASVAAMVRDFEGLDPEQAYAAAGSFVSSLIRRHGIAQVSAFFRACRPGADVAAAFAAVFGRTLESADADWRASL
jgi:hypothetical protein